MFCHNCGKQVPDGSSFCPMCGRTLAAAPQPEQPTQPTYTYQEQPTYSQPTQPIDLTQ